MWMPIYIRQNKDAKLNMNEFKSTYSITSNKKRKCPNLLTKLNWYS